MTTQAESARHLDMSVRRYRDLIVDGIVPKGSSLDQARVAYIQWLRGKASGRSETGSPQREKARFDKLRADQVELNLSKDRDQLLAVDDVRTAWTKFIMDTKQRLLAIPSKAAPECIGLKSKASIRSVIEAEIHGALHDLTEIDTSAYLDKRGKAAVRATPEADRKRVGRQRKKVKPRGKRRTRAVANK